MALGVDVKLKGSAELVNRLTKFDKDVAKVLVKEINSAVRLVANEAKAETPDAPLSRWGTWFESTGTNAQRGVVSLRSSTRDLSFVSGEVKSKTRPQFAKRYNRGKVIAFSARVVTMSPAGAIFALAGSRNAKTDFTKNLNWWQGKRWPRILSTALYSKGPQARKQIEAAIAKAAQSVGG